MLRQASISDLINARVSRGRGKHIVITMRRYPRFINRELRDEYIAAMAPSRELFGDWIAAKRKNGDHEGAFSTVNYEARFTLSEEGLEHLARLSEMSRKKDVYLLCQCQVGQRCHRELLLILARKWFKADAAKPRNSYPIFQRRISRREVFAHPIGLKAAA